MHFNFLNARVYAKQKINLNLIGQINHNKHIAEDHNNGNISLLTSNGFQTKE